MSRIKKALEKAKAERMALEQQERVVEKPKETEKVEAPRYFKTRVIQVSEEKLLLNKVVAVDEDDPVTDQFKLLRTRILHRTRSQGHNTIQVSGFDTDEGKSLVAVNLAICMAKDTRQTTLLVDVDFRKPTVYQLLDLGDDIPGLKSYFEGEAQLEELFVNPGIEKLTVLPAGGRLTNAPEVVGSPKMEALVKELKTRYSDRYIIFDTPGLNTCPDSLVFSEYVDAMVLVGRSDYTSQESIKTVMNLIPREKLIGTVLNDSQWLDSLAYYYRY
ncbi:MAG TPA: exopolysaccharide biosynthesis protein [Deltaproteobacteria bacterium]|nr:exopolysaccharide biosynthesis protein [Deltaproteobacteria bacterium]